MISKNQFKKMRRDGMADLEIATQLNVTPKEVFRARRKHGLLTDEEKVNIRRTRRNLIIGGGVSLALVGTAGAIYLVTKPITYENAVKDEHKRQIHIDQIVRGKIPPYVLSVKYATRGLLEKLAKHDYVPSKEVFADTIPIEMNEKEGSWEPITPDQIGKGAKSIVVVYSSVYDWHAKFPELERKYPRSELYKDMEIVLKNVLLRNEFTDAKNISLGIDGYPIKSFGDSSGNVNYRLFNLVTDLLSNVEEYRGVIAEPRMSNSPYLREYANGLKKQIATHHALLFDPKLVQNMNRQFISRLRHELHPNKILSN